MTIHESHAISNLDKVKGWLLLLSAEIIHSLLSLQNSMRLTGGIAEIGIHHGKLFTVAAETLQEDQYGLAIDLFSIQDKNVDKSGKGNREIFQRNMERFIPDKMSHIKILEMDSLDVTADEIETQIGQKARFFSIDGGHTAECTLNDMKLAAAVTAEHAIIVIDDVFNEHWPDVATGLAAFHYNSEPSPDIQPFAISPNKVFYCRPAFANRFRAHLKAVFGNRYWHKESAMYGASVDIYTPPPPNSSERRPPSAAGDRFGSLLKAKGAAWSLR